ncbi:MAG: hypothetical protein AAB906_03760 [Patescibacteria group bacterium]
MRGYIPCGACGYEGPNAGPCPECGRMPAKTEIPVQTKVHEMPRRAFRCSDVVLKKVATGAMRNLYGFRPDEPNDIFSTEVLH